VLSIEDEGDVHSLNEDGVHLVVHGHELHEVLGHGIILTREALNLYAVLVEMVPIKEGRAEDGDQANRDRDLVYFLAVLRLKGTQD